MVRWTDEELDFLKSNYGKTDAEAIGEKLERSSNAVRHKAQRLGLAEKRDFWQEDEETYLEYFAFERDSDLSVAADFLGRSVNATGLRLSKLREKRKDYYFRRPWTIEEDMFIKNHYKSISYKSIGIRLNRSHKAVIERASNLGLKKYTSIASQDEEIRKLVTEKYLCDAARELGINADNLRSYLKKHNIDYKVLTREESLERARAKSPWHLYKFIF